MINHHKNPTKFFLLLLRIPENRLPEILERGKDDPQQSRGQEVCLFFIFGLIGKGQGRVGKHCHSLWTKKFSNISNGPSCVHPIFLFWSNELLQILFLPIFVSLGAQNIADFPLFFGQSTKYRRFLTHSEQEQSTSFSRRCYSHLRWCFFGERLLSQSI